MQVKTVVLALFFIVLLTKGLFYYKTDQVKPFFYGDMKIELYPLSGVYRVPITAQSVEDPYVLKNMYYMRIFVKSNSPGIFVRVYIDGRLWENFSASGKELYVLTTAFPQYMRFHLGVHTITYVIGNSHHLIVKKGVIDVVLSF